jgi:hypothetical protein
MLRLIETNLVATGKGDFGNRPHRASWTLDTGHPSPAVPGLTLQIVTNQIEFWPVTVFSRMDRHLCWGPREDQPTVASVNR